MLSTLGVAAVAVVVLFVVAMLPPKKKDGNVISNVISSPFQSEPRECNFRKQQIREESEAIASEYRRRADEAWLEELSVKASTLLGSHAKPAVKKA